MDGLVNGLTARSTPRPVIGYSDTETVKLDFDETPFKKVKYWALRTMTWFNLGGFLVLKSSPQCYHVIFNRKVTWTENVSVMAWVTQQTKHPKLTGWFILQCRKQKSTLRVSSKGKKSSPRIVFRYGHEHKRIRHFLQYRMIIKRVVKRLKGENSR
jgi:hypothetical protein